MSDFDFHHGTPIAASAGFQPSLLISSRGEGFPPATKAQHPGSTGKRKKTSKAKLSPIMKRAVSTPQMIGMGEEDTEGLSPTALEKRKNKLGYQRISIACGHCRRRKIRCVLADQDDMGRCQNCIRLKKECVFYPVDAAGGGGESRAQNKPGSESRTSSIMSNSPSDRKHSAYGDSDRDFGRFPALASNAPSELTSGGSSNGLGISTSSTMTTPEYGYDSRDGWHAGALHQGDSAASDGSRSWRVHDSPRTDHFPGFPPSEQRQHGGPIPGYHYPPGRDYGMQPPMRSISFGNIEPSLGQYHHSPTTSGMDHNRSDLTSHYPPQVTDPHHVAMTSSMLDPAISAGGSDGHQYGMYSPQWQYGYPQHSPHSVGMEFPRHDSVNTQWYPPHMSQVVDEQGRVVHQQQWHHQPHHLMPPPGSGYSKGHSPG